MKFMAGRNGTDQLCRFLSFASLFFLLLATFAASSPFGASALVLAAACLFYCWFRALSKNTYRRSQENAAYLRLQNRVLGRFRGFFGRMKQRKDYRFYRCPSCKARLRVPKGKGKVSVTCRGCGAKFIKKS